MEFSFYKPWNIEKSRKNGWRWKIPPLELLGEFFIPKVIPNALF